MARILVCGAGIAGCATAWWLVRRGFDVTLVERTPEFRTGGQNIDVRGQAREVVRRMGLEAAALALNTTETGTAWVDAAGRTAAEFGVGDGDGPTAEMEILRGDLARLLYDGVRDRAEVRFGDHVAAIDDRGDGARVTFDGGAVERFDLVIVAEGVGSHTRELVFPRENDPRWMDETIAYFTIPRTAGDDRRWRWFNAPDKRSISLRPDPHATTRAMLALHGRAHGEQDWPPARQKAFLADRFADAGWEAPRVLAAMAQADDFYFDALRQVRMPRYASGRVVLTGDAAWCVTPLAGMGSSLALIGAYVLAGELAVAADLIAGLARYEAVMRPLVKRAGNVPKLGPRLLHPRTRAGIAALHGVLRLATSAPARALAGKFGSSRRPPDPLPDYPPLA